MTIKYQEIKEWRPSSILWFICSKIFIDVSRCTETDIMCQISWKRGGIEAQMAAKFN